MVLNNGTFLFVSSSLLTVGTFRVEARAPAAAPLQAAPTLTFQPGTAIQTALQFPSALDLDPQQPPCDGSLKAHHNLLFP